jgi:hypothetical protein
MAQAKQALHLIKRKPKTFKWNRLKIYVLKKMNTAAPRARMAPRVGKKPLSSAGMNFLSPNHRKNRMVSQSAIIDRSMVFSFGI